MTPKGRFREEEEDLFNLQPYTSGVAIPRIERVPITKEELRRRRILRVTYTVLAALAIAFVTWLYLHLSHLSAVNEAMQGASDDGRVGSVRNALALLSRDDDPASRALRLRLRAMLVLAGVNEPVEPIENELRQLPAGDEDVVRERSVAETYLALARGDLAAAMQGASGIAPQGDYAAESARARALAAHFVGNADQALTAARSAANERPEAPRHVALYAEILARKGRTRQALQQLDRVPAEHRNAATRIARARILDQMVEHAEQVKSEAQAVLEDDAATPHEKAWARLLLARSAAADGDRVTARRHLDQAAEVAPPGDELFTLALTEAALRIDADHLAQQVAQRLPSPLSVDAARRAQLSAELALARHELADAEGALQNAPAGARTTLARARLLEAREQIDEARGLYQQAARDPAFRVPAMVHLAAMELAQGNALAASDGIRPLLSEHRNHPDVVPVAVEARLGLNQPQDAMQLVEPALRAHPDDVRLLAAKAHVQMALARWEEALSTLDAALRIQSDDADLHADRGRAARQLNRLEVAREAFDAALALSASHPIALVGRLELDLLQLRPAEGRQMMDRIDRAQLRSLAIERLRARLLMMEVAGQSGLAQIRRALSRHGRDTELILAQGWLWMQAEEFSNAVSVFTRIDSGSPPPLGPILGRVLAQVRMRASNPARAVMHSAMSRVDEATLDPAMRAEVHAVLGRLAEAQDNRAVAAREAQQALTFDPRNSEAHLLLADLAAERNQNDRPELEAALTGIHPSSRPLAVLSIRENRVSDATCEYAARYRRAAPGGQYARGVLRVLRDCRRRRGERVEDDEEP